MSGIQDWTDINIGYLCLFFVNPSKTFLRFIWANNCPKTTLIVFSIAYSLGILIGIRVDESFSPVLYQWWLKQPCDHQRDVDSREGAVVFHTLRTKRYITTPCLTQLLSSINGSVVLHSILSSRLRILRSDAKSIKHCVYNADANRLSTLLTGIQTCSNKTVKTLTGLQLHFHFKADCHELPQTNPSDQTRFTCFRSCVVRFWLSAVRSTVCLLLHWIWTARITYYLKTLAVVWLHSWIIFLSSVTSYVHKIGLWLYWRTIIANWQTTSCRHARTHALAHTHICRRWTLAV